MRHNGTLQYETRTGGGINEYGEPTAATTQWSEPIPCLVSVNSDSHIGAYEDGEFQQASYKVLTERTDMHPERIRLCKRSKVLGEFRVISIAVYDTYDRTEMLVS